MTSIRAFSILALLVLSLSASAQTSRVYKWVDEEGVTHYTTTPPPNDADYERLKLRTGGGAAQSTSAIEPSASSDQSEEAEPEETYLERRQREAEERQAKAQERQMMAEECAQAQRALTFYTTYTRIDEPTADGTTVRRITEEERQSHIQTARDRVAQYCNP